MHQITTAIHEEIATKMSAGLIGEATAFMRLRLAPMVAADLRKRFQHLAQQDAEDIATQAIDIVEERLVQQPGSINNLGGYTWTTALRLGWRENRKKENHEHVDVAAAEAFFAEQSAREDQSTRSTSQFAPDERAKFLYEGLFADDEIAADSAKTVVAACLPALDSGARAIVELLLGVGFDLPSPAGAEILGITPVAFRVRKHRAYKKLEQVLPAKAQELGVQILRHPFAPGGSIADALVAEAESDNGGENEEA